MDKHCRNPAFMDNAATPVFLNVKNFGQKTGEGYLAFLFQVTTGHRFALCSYIATSARSLLLGVVGDTKTPIMCCHIIGRAVLRPAVLAPSQVHKYRAIVLNSHESMHRTVMK
jgi:hypothetical protein